MLYAQHLSIPFPPTHCLSTQDTGPDPPCPSPEPVLTFPSGLGCNSMSCHHLQGLSVGPGHLWTNAAQTEGGKQWKHKPKNILQPGHLIISSLNCFSSVSLSRPTFFSGPAITTLPLKRLPCPVSVLQRRQPLLPRSLHQGQEKD